MASDEILAVAKLVPDDEATFPFLENEFTPFIIISPLSPRNKSPP